MSRNFVNRAGHGIKNPCSLSRRRWLLTLAAVGAAPWSVRVRAAGAQRVLALGPGALRLLVYLGGSERLVGIEEIERRPLAASTYRQVLPERLQTLPVVGPGGAGQMPDVEQVLALRPELVVTVTLDGQQLETLRGRAGVPVLPLSYGETGFLQLAAVIASLRRLGEALGESERAARLIDFMLANLAALRALVAQQVPVPAYLGGVSLMGAHGLVSTQAGHPPLAWAGADNLADQAGRPGHLFLDREQVLFWDPPTLFIDGGGLAGILREYARDPGYYHQLSAVRAGRVYLTLPFNAYNTNIENAFVNAWLMAKVLHPTALAGRDLHAEARAIMTAFLGRDPLPTLAEHGYGWGRLDLASGRWTADF